MKQVMIGAAALALAAPLTLRAEDVDLDALRSALDKYQDLNVALADGYVPDTDCVTAEMESYPAEMEAMGIHYLHPELLQITGDDPEVAGTGTRTPTGAARPCSFMSRRPTAPSPWWA